MGRQNLPKPRQDLESATDVAWAVAVERERWIAKLAAEKYVRVHDADAAADALDLTRTMIYRLVARYRARSAHEFPALRNAWKEKGLDCSG
jgi:hypothetical protein